MSFDRLISAIDKTGNPTVAGLDPQLDYVPAHIKQQAFEEFGDTLDAAAATILAFNKGLIDALWDIVPAVKPQCAYYEMYGWQGVKALAETIAYAKEKGLFVITDGKRNDIGSTMQAYALAHLGKVRVSESLSKPFGGDALTVNGYLGTDGIAPLLEVCKKEDKGIFVLCKTSNPSSGELQDKLCGDATVYELMGNMCREWGKELPGAYGYTGVGAVVGATYPEQLAKLRKSMPDTLFLIPGYGAQGGKAADIACAFDKNGRGAIVNSSRAIMCAYQKSKDFGPEEYALAARAEALRMRDELTSLYG